jgi:hypothetical protein
MRKAWRLTQAIWILSCRMKLISSILGPFL